VTARAAATLVAALVLVFASSACSGGHEDASPPSGPTRLVVAFTGEDLGRVEPCGCTSAMLGGLARRPARIRASMEPGVPFAYVSGGRLVAGTDEYDRLRLRTILRALKTMDCAVFAPSWTELVQGQDLFQLAVRGTGVPAVSTALAPDVTSIVKLPTAGVAAYATGLCEVSDVVVGAEISRELRARRSELAAGTALVVLTNSDLNAARGFARDVAGPTLFLYAAGRTEPRDSDVIQGGVAFAPYPAKGEFVGVARLVGDAWIVEYRPVLHDLPEDPAIVAQRAAHLAEMRSAELVRKSSSIARFAVGTPPPAGDYVGNESCADCHANATKSWTASKHARAMASLVATGDDVDPGCVRCHVVAYGTGRGFVDARSTKNLADVGCEACHGPRAAHVESRRAGRADAPSPRVGETACAACHDSEHDPNFEFASYWARIVHDGK
jgi:hypothetical protein